MKHRSALVFILVLGGLIAAGLLLLFSRVPMMPLSATLEAGYVDGAWNGLLRIETAVYGLVMAYIAWCLIAFRASKRSEQGEKFDRSRGRLAETAWILASTMLTLGMAALGAHELRAVLGRPEADIDVEVRAQQFSWEFYYPKEKLFGSNLFLEKGKRHRIILTSQDVVHSFWVPEFRLKQDAVPGKVIHLLMTPTKTGAYELLCSELCGFGHTDMTARVQVLEHEAFEKALQGDAF